MRYIVMKNGEAIAEKESMDDALDVLSAYEGFDEQEGILVDGSYMIEIAR